MQRLTTKALAAACMAGVGLLTGCAGGETFSCESSDRYAAAQSIPPLRVPDDLSPPDEDDALQIPPVRNPDAPAPGEGQPCLEAPPDFDESRDG